MDTLALNDGLCNQYTRTTSVYYPPAASTAASRPRSHSTGSPVGTPKRTTVKIVMGKGCTTKSRPFDREDSKSKQCQSTTSRYKTELCRPYQEYRVCKYGDKCQFAHGEHDLRILPRHPKYKTELCRTYHSTGFCPYGPRCHFIHNLDEARQPDTPPCSPIKKSSVNAFTTTLPISPSVDSGISSPDGYPGNCRSFEFPAISGSQGSSGSGSGSDEGGEDQNRKRYDTYSSLSGDYDLEASESGINIEYTRPELFHESDALSSRSSPLKPIGNETFNIPSDPGLDLHNLLMGLGIKDTPAIPPPSPRMSPPLIGAGSGSLNSARRLPVFDDMMNSKSDTALLVGYASDPGSRGSTSFPTFP